MICVKYLLIMTGAVFLCFEKSMWMLIKYWREKYIWYSRPEYSMFNVWSNNHKLMGISSHLCFSLSYKSFFRFNILFYFFVVSIILWPKWVEIWLDFYPSEASKTVPSHLWFLIIFINIFLTVGMKNRGEDFIIPTCRNWSNDAICAIYCICKLEKFISCGHKAQFLHSP